MKFSGILEKNRHPFVISHLEISLIRIFSYFSVVLDNEEIYGNLIFFMKLQICMLKKQEIKIMHQEWIIKQLPTLTEFYLKNYLFFLI